VDVAKALAAGQIVGLANGRAEYGPRALGNRSLLADPRKPDIKNDVNKIKQRQAFRPFAPVVLAERAHEYFDMPVSESPYMQFVARCKQPDEVPGICHVDSTSRIQTVTRQQNKLLRSVLESFYEITGCPILLNTSLNIRGEPIVNSREDAQDFALRYGVIVF
jgi:carbamoyltransferase